MYLFAVLPSLKQFQFLTYYLWIFNGKECTWYFYDNFRKLDNQSNSILICASTNEVDNFDCKEVMSLISKSYGGKGGGKKNLAQAGCNNISSIDEGLEIIKTRL